MVERKNQLFKRRSVTLSNRELAISSFNFITENIEKTAKSCIYKGQKLNRVSCDLEYFAPRESGCQLAQRTLKLATGSQHSSCRNELFVFILKFIFIPIIKITICGKNSLTPK